MIEIKNRITVECQHCNHEVNINVDPASFCQVEAPQEREMGHETIYECAVERKCPDCRHQWSVIRVSEYPEGAINEQLAE